jgi:Methyltransferase domain
MDSTASRPTPEEEFLARVAPSLDRIGERFWTDNKPSDALHGVSYPSDAQEKLAAIEDTSFWFRHRQKMICALVDRFRPAGPIIDIGGGNGYVALGLKRLSLPVIVFEPGADGALAAHRRGLVVVKAEFNSETFAKGSLAGIALFDVLEHFKEDVDFLVHCCAALAAGSYVYVSVPALMSLWSSDDVFAGHFRRYDRQSLADALKKAGLEVRAIGYFFSLLVPPVYLLRTLPSVLGWRSVTDADEAVEHHRVNLFISGWVERILDFEARMSDKGRMMPFGTSLLAVAQMPRAS